MSVIVFAEPILPPEPPAALSRPNLAMTWHGWDGSVWPLTRDAGVFLAPDGIRGMGNPTITRHTSSSPALHGTRNRGFIVEEREVFWPTRVKAVTRRALAEDELWRGDWAELDNRFWKTMHPGKTGTWSVTKPGGGTRKLGCRFVSDEWETSGSPFTTQAAWYGISMVAEQPFWLGDPITRSWAAADERLFFGGGDPNDPMAIEAGPPFYISNTSSYGTAEITNPGDVEAWPRWKIRGPFDSATLGVGDAIIEIPFGRSAGTVTVIDTSPEAQTCMFGDGANPIDHTDDLGSVTWAPIPAGESVELNVETVNGGSVEVEIVPRYLRAW